MVRERYGNQDNCCVDELSDSIALSECALICAYRGLCKLVCSNEVLPRCRPEPKPCGRAEGGREDLLHFWRDVRETVEFGTIHKGEFYKLALGSMGHRTKLKGKEDKNLFANGQMGR